MRSVRFTSARDWWIENTSTLERVNTTEKQGQTARTKTAMAWDQISQRQRISCWRRMGWNENGRVSNVASACNCFMQTAYVTTSAAARRDDSRSCELRFSSGAAGSSFSTEHRHCSRCDGWEQQLYSASIEGKQQHAPIPQWLPACTSGAIPPRRVAATSTQEVKEWIENGNIATPVKRKVSFVLWPRLTTVKSEFCSR